MKKHIKNINHFVASLLFVAIVSSCNIDEEPVTYAGEKLFGNVEGAHTALNGVYSSLIAFNYYGADYHHLLNMGSGLFSTDRVPSYNDIAGLNPTSSLNFVTNVWKAMYQTIGYCNDLIQNIEAVERTDPEYNNILGQAYFIRSLTYFHLVRIYGGVPLLTAPVTPDNLHNPRMPVEDVFDQIILDAERAQTLLPEYGSNQAGRPSNTAANMLLAKVYIQMAGNKTSTETEYWQKAYDHAILVYNTHTLVADFRSLWHDETGNNTDESIFEIQSTPEATLRLHQLFTTSKGFIGEGGWGRFRTNLEVYDKHIAIYPTDPRINSTYVTQFTEYNTKNIGDTLTRTTYPHADSQYDNRDRKQGAYPYCYKYWIKDHTATTYSQNQSFIVFRYAELLLMLAEISNELQNGEQLTYVTEVLDRVGLTPQAGYSGDQVSFREAIMYEYQFELYSEGDDFFRVRRRGYETWLKPHVIEAHNNHPVYGDFSGKYDAPGGYPDNSRIMLMPIPSTEITANNMISAADQNPGY